MLRTGLGTLALTATLLAAALWVSERVDPIYEEAATRNALLAEAAPYIEAGVFGNSHAHAVQFDRLGREGFYFNQPGGDLFESRRILQHALTKAPGLREVYLGLSPFQGDNGQFPPWHGRRRMVYAQTGSLRPIHGDWRVALSTPLARLARPDHGYGVLRPRPSDSLRSDGYMLTWTRWKQSADRIAELARERATEHAAGARSIVAEDPTFCESLERALQGFVEDAGQRRVVLFTPPYYVTYLSERPPCDVTISAHRLAAAHTNVVYLDYSRSSMSRRAELFMDGSHINATGSRVFSDSLRHDLAAHWGD